MATTRSKKSGDSKPVEKKQVEAPKAKEAPKPVEKKQDEAPKAKEAKEAPNPVEKKAAAPKAKELSCRHAQHSHLGKGLILEEFTSNNKAYYKVKFENQNHPMSVLQSRIIKE